MFLAKNIEEVGRSFDIDNQSIDVVIGILMDTLARVLYVENPLQEINIQEKASKKN